MCALGVLTYLNGFETRLKADHELNQWKLPKRGQYLFVECCRCTCKNVCVVKHPFGKKLKTFENVMKCSTVDGEMNPKWKIQKKYKYLK